MNPLKWKLHWQILASLSLAFATGIFLNGPAHPVDGEAPAWVASAKYYISFPGTLFLNALKMIVVPLVVSSIVLGILNVGAEKDFGRLGIKTLGFYVLTGLLAVVVGLMMVNLLQPGNVDPEIHAQMKIQGESADSGKVAGALENAERGSRGFLEIFIRMIPVNLFAAASEGKLLGLIFFSLLFGYFASRLPEKQRNTQFAFWESLNSAIVNLTQFIIRFAPIGVFGLVAPTIIDTGWGLFKVMGVFAVTVVAALCIHFLITLPLLLRLLGKVKNPYRHHRAMAPALLTAFSTASSSSTLPLTMSCVNKNAGVSKKITGFTLPLGATVNMDGTALYECVVVIFLAQLFNVQMEFADQFQVVLLALLTSIGVAGIPSASLVAIIVILNAAGFSAENIAMGVGIVLVVDRVLDMIRTAVNVFGDSCAAVVIARSEGEKGVLE
ncbi:MAG: dicarboxylate/amino acid:cation symporter [Opitutae bacterium]